MERYDDDRLTTDTTAPRRPSPTDPYRTERAPVVDRVEARQGSYGRPVLYILIAGLILAAIYLVSTMFWATDEVELPPGQIAPATDLTPPPAATDVTPPAATDVTPPPADITPPAATDVTPPPADITPPAATDVTPPPADVTPPPATDTPTPPATPNP